MTDQSIPIVSATVLIPTFNRTEFLPEAISSMLAQTVAAGQILVVDDGSSEDVAAAISRFGDRVGIIRKENGGKATALNVGLAHCTSEFVWIFDDDDVATSDALERLSAPLLENPELGFCFGGHNSFTDGADGRRVFEESTYPVVPSDAIFPSLLGRFLLNQPGLLVRRRCYEAVGPFDEAMRFSEDFEMSLRLARRFRGIQIGGAPVFSRREHLGPRGGGGARLRTGDREKAWKPFNQDILRRLRATCALEEFLPRPHVTPLSQQDRFSALLQRSVALGRRGVWDDAAEDLSLAAATANAAAIDRLTPAQSAILRTLFDPWSEGATEFAGATRFRRALLEFASQKLRRDIRLNAGWGLPYLIRGALRNEGIGAGARLALGYAHMVSAPVIARTFLSKAKLRISRPGR